jgi:hypothetical protein
MNDEMERIWKKALFSFKVLSRHSLGGAEESHKKPQSG